MDEATEALLASWDEEALGSSVAVIGMAGRFPGAPDLETFWHNLAAGVESVTFFTREELLAAGVPTTTIDDPTFVPARAVIEDPTCFDAPFFRMSPREAELTDPQHRLFLECAWASLEDAACDPKRFTGSIGLFAGCSANTYLVNNLLTDRTLLESMGGLQAILASDKDHLATRTSYLLGLTGPSVTVQTSCSTSLVAVQMAYWSLLTYQADMMLAGGVSLNVPFVGGHRHQTGSIFSSDGHCRAFDAEASGTLSGDGVGIVVLRRLEDALRDGDPIRAVIRGAAINNDGHQKIGYAAPSIEGQAGAIAAAHQLADIPLTSITYLEAHGTATALGDPVEVAALTQAFRLETEDTGFCALGSVKTNLGHLNAAAGIAGLIKTVLALEHTQIPPNLHYQAPNPNIDFAATPFVVNQTLCDWPQGESPRRAGVSSFGAGGTNAHVIVEEAPPRPQRLHTQPDPEKPLLLVLSAQTPAALDAATARLAGYLQRHPDQRPEDIAATLQTARHPMPYRRGILATTTAQATTALQDHTHWIDGFAGTGHTRPITFLYPAQGTQRLDMGRQLYDRDGLFRSAFDRCCAIAQEGLDIDLRGLLFPSSDKAEEAQATLEDQRYAGPALFCLGYALTEWWKAQGVVPAAVFGQSTGEYTAACVAGIMDLQDAIRLLHQRAQLITQIPKGTGLFVPLAADILRPMLVDDTYIALINAPEAVVATGTIPGIKALHARLSAQGIHTKPVRISGPAHSPLMKPIAAPLEQAARQIALRPPRIPVLSGITGTWLTPKEATDPAYWSRHLVEPVQAAQAVQTLQLAPHQDHVLLELGPAKSISPLIAYNLPQRLIIPSLAHHRELPVPAETGHTTLRSLAQLWTEGALTLEQTPWARPGQRIALPTYPFARIPHWIEPAPHTVPAMSHLGVTEHTSQGAPRDHQRRRHPRRLSTTYVAPRTPAEATLVQICEEIFAIEPIGVEDNFFALGADSLITLRLVREVEQRFNYKVPAAAAFSELTIARMAAFLGPEMDTPTQSTQAHHPHRISCMVPIQPTGSRPPLFLIHPAAGVIFPYFPLVRALGPEQPVYLIQAHGLDGLDAPDKHVEEMAARYIPLIQEVQPHGPYFVAGFSFGCYVSFEIAHLLKRIGEDVAFLGLIDEVAPRKGSRPNIIHLSRLLFGRAGRSFVHHLFDYLSLKDPKDEPLETPDNRAKGLWQRFSKLDRSKGLLTMLQRSAMTALLHPQAQAMAFEQPAMGPMFELFLSHCFESYRYTPPVYEGRASLFKSDWWYDRRWLDPVSRDPSLGWRHLVKNDLEIRRASGDHLGILRQPHVEILAREMQASLALARKRCGLSA